MSEARDHFESIGRLTKCNTRPLTFCIGRLFVWIRLSGNGGWETLGEGGHLYSDWVSCGPVRYVDGTTTFRLVLWRLSVRLAWLESGR